MNRTSTSTGIVIGVVIPVRDGAAFIADAIESVLGQTVPPGDVVVVDDGSTDATPELVSGYGPPVRVLRQPPDGYAAALNRGIRAVRGELVAFLDADDVWTADKLEVQLAALEADSTLDAVYGRARQFVDDRARVDGRSFRFDAAPVDSYLLTAALIRREVFERVGVFDVERDAVAAVEWHARSLALGLRTAVVPTLVIERRIHGENLSLRDPEAKARDLTRVVRAHLQRRRGGDGVGDSGEAP